MNHLGGVSGLLSTFCNMSVTEVRNICKALGRCASGKEVLEKRSYITELFMDLQPQVFPDVSVKTTDRCPWGNYYRHLIASCTEELVECIVSGGLKGR
jgi:hypothetical protein